MDKNQKLTGYPHIDKMWNKYYDRDFLNQAMPQMNILDYMKSMNNGNEEGTAITYYGNEISFNELYENIDNASKVLINLGVSCQDRIMYLLPNIPETAYLMYGTTQIGAIADYVDPRPDSINLQISANKILNLFNNEKIKYIISLDQCYLGLLKPIENELRERGLKEIILISAADSMNFRSQLEYMSEILSISQLKGLSKKLHMMKEMKKALELSKKGSKISVLNYSDLLKEVRYTKLIQQPYESDTLNLIVHTSGTSSPFPKPIPLTNDNLNAYAHQTFGANMDMQRGDRALHILPYFAAFGSVDVAHSGLCHGTNLLQIPEFSPNNLGNIILRYKPNIIIGPPTWFLSLTKDKKLKKADLSFLKMITYGGDSMEEQDEKEINDFFNDHNCKAAITKGHGLSETCGCASYAVGEYNKPKSIGIPMPNTIYALRNPNTKELIKFEEEQDIIEGELLISAKTITSGKLDNQVVASHVQYGALDFLVTGDFIKMDRDGVMYYLGRSDRTFTRFDGFKVRPYLIENIIKNDKRVKYCGVVSYEDNEKSGLMPIAHIVLNSEEDLSDEDKVNITKQIIINNFINNADVSTRLIPSKFKFRKNLPLTINGKFDYHSLETEGIDGNEVCVILEETNVSLGSLEVSMSKQKKLVK